MKHVSRRLEAMDESQTIAMARKSRELAAQGVDVISLTLGEPDFNTPDFIQEAAIEAIRQNYSHYTPISGYLDLRESIARKFKRDNQLDYTASQIVVSTGAKQSLANAILALVDPGDEVILPTPYWVSYKEMVKLAEGASVFVEATVEQGYRFTAEQLRRALTPKSRVLMFSNPCNPSGAVYSRSELEAIAAVVAEHPNLIVVSDEIYELIRFEGEHVSFASLPGMYERTVTVNGLSKGFAMTGWRLGYLGAPQWIASACDKLQGQFTSATCSIAQRAAIAALEAPPSQVAYMVEAFAKRRALTMELLKTVLGFIAGEPGGAFYVFPHIGYWLGRTVEDRVIQTSDDLCMYLLERAHVGLVPGDAFGSPKALRISYATSEERLTVAFERIRLALTPYC